MAGQVLEEFEVESFHASALANSYAGPLWAPSDGRASTFREEADGLYVSRADSFRCAKGLMVALGMEAAAALCFYGLWHLWHILR
jgi:hypothetical protein